MIEWNGLTFETEELFLAYIKQFFGDAWYSNWYALKAYGSTLDGTYYYVDGIKQLGTLGQAIAQYGTTPDVPSAVQYIRDAVQGLPVQEFSEPAEMLNNFTQSGVVTPVITQTQNIPAVLNPVVTPTSNTNIPTVAEMDFSRYIAGTGGITATMKAIGGASLPAFWAAVAPLLGVGFGFTLYDLSPDFWDGLSRTLLPFCYEDSDGVQKVPMVMDTDGTTYFGEDVINATRDYLINNGAYEAGDYEADITDGYVLRHPNYMNLPISFVPNVNHFGVVEKEDRTVVDVYYYTLPSNYYIISASDSEQYLTSDFFNVRIITTEENSTVHVSRLRYVKSTGETTYTENYGDYAMDRVTDRLGNAYYVREIINGRILSSAISAYNIVTNAGIDITDIYTNINNYIKYQNMNESSRREISGDIGYALYHGTITGGEGVPGTSIIAGSTLGLLKDPTKTLQDVHPTWYDRAKDILTKATVGASDYLNSVTKYLPVTISNTTNGTDLRETESTEDMNGALVGIATGINAISSIAEMILDATKTINDTDDNPPDYPDDDTGNTDPPTPPVLSGAGTDLIAIYNPTKDEIISFNQWLWDLDPLNIANWQKLFGNPIDAVISLQMLYAVPSTGESRNIKVGFMTSSVSSKIVTNQYIDIDCGTVSINEMFHTIHDYTATSVHIYLPFIGIVPLRIGDVMKSTLHLYYRIDVLTGTCLAQIDVIKENSRAVLYSFNGTCSVQLPLTSGQFSGIFSTLLSAGSFALSTGTGIAGAVGSVAHDVLSGGVRQDVRMSGTLGSNAGAMGIRTPYVIITRNKPVTAYDYNRQYGYPAHKTVVLSQVSGYTRVRECHLESVPCTDEERAMIYRSLTDGVIIQ